MAIDLGLLAKRLEEPGIEDVVVQGSQITVLMKDIGLVARVYSSGIVHRQAGLWEDCERACDIIFIMVLAKNGQGGKGQ
jgi:hypothetical protein